MVFKRPGSGRSDKQGNSSNRANSSNNGSKRSTSSRGNSDRNSDRPNKSQSSNFSGERGGNRRSSSPTGGRPYSGRPADGNDRPARKSFSRGADSEGGEKRPYASKGSRPYSGRPSDGDSRPKRDFKSREGGERKFGSDSPRSSRPAQGDRKFDSDRPRTPRTSGSGDRNFSSDKPRTSRPSGDRNFSSDKPRTSRPSQGDRKFAGKRDDNFRDRPARREKPEYSDFREERKAPVKTMRGRKEKETKAKDDNNIRLNRYIANAGICSRRKADELIEAGVISVNGEVVNELGFKVDPFKDVIRYNGELLKREKMVYVLLNKPKDYITTTDDPQERRTVMHLVEKASRERIYPIGRLDRNTTGLLLMTNDGDLAEKLSHPRSNVTKLYQVELSKSLTQGDLNKISFGIELEDGVIKPDAVSYVTGGTKREIGIQIHSGKNRIVRRIFEHLGYEVVKLDRVIYANLTKKDLPRGRWRYLDEKEVIQLKHLV